MSTSDKAVKLFELIDSLDKGVSLQMQMRVHQTPEAIIGVVKEIDDEQQWITIVGTNKEEMHISIDQIIWFKCLGTTREAVS